MGQMVCPATTTTTTTTKYVAALVTALHTYILEIWISYLNNFEGLLINTTISIFICLLSPLNGIEQTVYQLIPCVLRVMCVVWLT